MPNQITAHNAGWRYQFRFAVSVFGVFSLGGDTSTRKSNKLMKTNEEPQMRDGGLRSFVWFLRALSHPVFTPEADERRFLTGLPIAIYVIIFLWGRGWLQSLGPSPVLVTSALWCIAYVIKYRKRLKNRGELKRAIIAPASFVALLLGVSLY